jgi:saccharopine dehydrogenase-like NADP-dependent oxidoreductase
MKIAVLGGAGAMARVTLRDLLASPEVKHILVGDLNLDAATALIESLDDERLEAAGMDARDIEGTAELIKGYDVVINSTQYYFNLEVMKACLLAKVHYLDLGGLFHMTRKQVTLHEDFKKAGLLALLGCGSTPGMTNVMARYAVDRLEKVHSIDIKIGAADFADTGDEFAVPYSIDTILDECVIPPYVYDEGQWAELPPFSGAEDVQFPHPIGQGVAHYTIHSEVATFPVSFENKGIRRATFRIAFPANFIKTLKLLVDLKLADSTPREIKGVSVKPRDVLVNVLTPAPHQQNGLAEPNDCDCIRVEISGTRGGQDVHYTMESVIFPRKEWGASAGAYDTGVPPSILAQMIAKGEIPERGVLSPEQCVPPVPFFRALAERNINVTSLVREPVG